MWTAWLLLTLNGLFFTLRLAGNTGSFPRALTREEEQDCLERMAKGDDDARDMLIEHNLRLVAHIVKKYYTPNGDQDDLISIGTIGLIKGVSTFKPDKNVRLATYASRCIENAMCSQRPGYKKEDGLLYPILVLMYLSDRINQLRLLFHGTGQRLDLLDDRLRMGSGDLLGKLLLRLYGLWAVHDKAKRPRPPFMVIWHYMPNSLSYNSVLCLGLLPVNPNAKHRGDTSEI